MLKQLALSAALVGVTSSVAVAGNGTNLTKFVSDTTTGLVVVDVAKARSSKLVKDGMNTILDLKPDARAKLEGLGLDPLRDIDTVLFAFGGVDQLTMMKDQGTIVLVVEGRFPKAVTAKLEANGTKSSIGGVDVFTRDDTEGAIIGGRLFFARSGKLAPVIELATGKSKASLAASAKAKPLRDAIAKANTRSHVWAAIALPDKDRANAASGQVPIQSIGLGIALAKDVTATVKLNAALPADAATSFTTLEAALPQIKQMFHQIGLVAAADSMAVKQDKASVVASMKITDAEVKTLAALAGMVAGEKKSGGNAPAPPPPQDPFSKPKSPGLGGAAKP